MELAVGAFVAAMVAAFAAGLGIGLWWRRRGAASPSAPTLTDPAPASDHTSELERVRAALAAAEHELARLRGESPVAGAATDSVHRGSSHASGVPAGEPDLRRRFADIIGLESEIASLRAVAARVPALERRIRELEAASPGDEISVVDLGHRPSHTP